MKQIASFCIDHDTLKKGLYTSRIDGDVVTYDLRMTIPNAGIYLDNAGIHTFEHLFATYVRNTPFSDQVVYVGPMGCRTGFYFLVRDSLTPAQVIGLVRESMDFIASFEGPIPGAQYSRECGNYLNHDLAAAHAYARDMADVLKGWTPEMLRYEYGR